MKAKKIAALAASLALCFSVAVSSLMQAGAANPTTVTPEVPATGYSNPKLVMYPGNVYWGNAAPVDAWGDPNANPGFDFSEHIYSQYAQYNTGEVIYKPLDVPLNEGREGKYQGMVDASSPTYYRDLLWYGTFQGVRIDYALQPKLETAALNFRIAPGSYVATGMLISSYWLKLAEAGTADPVYDNLVSGWKFESSADGVTWTPLENVDIYWEHGNEKGENANAYCTAIASAKLPDDHTYYKVTPPTSVEGNTMLWDAVMFGPTKVSSTPMDQGKTGDANANYYAASTISPVEGEPIIDTVTFDSDFKGISVNYNGDVLVGEIMPLLSGVNLSILNTDGTPAADSDKIVTGMKLRAASEDGQSSWEYTITKKGGLHTTIGPNDPKKTLLPGVTDYLDYDYIPSLGTDRMVIFYTDYAMSSANTWIAGTSLTQRNNKHYGTFFGRTNNAAFNSWDDLANNDVIYRVLPDSYVSTAIMVHLWAIKANEQDAFGNADLYKNAVKEYIFSTSPDGHTWTELEVTDADIVAEHGFSAENPALGYCSGRVCFKIPAGHRYYKITAPVEDGMSLLYNMRAVGPTKASLTDMHEGEGDTTAMDPVSEIYAKDIANVWLNEVDKTLTVNTKASTMTIQEVLDQLVAVKATIKFFNADGTEITDTSTAFAAGMTMKAFDEAGEQIAELATVFNFVAPPEEPGYEISDTNIMEPDGEYMIIKSEITSLQEILDALTLKGDAEVYFYSAEGDEITDLTTLAANDMSFGIYSATKGELATFIIQIEGTASSGSTPDDSNGNKNDETENTDTGVAVADLAFAVLAVSGAGLIVFKKKNKSK